MKFGFAPCQCGLYAKNVRLTGKEEGAGDGGKWCECEPRQFCIRCSEPWNWLHIPPAEDLLMPLMRQEEEKELVGYTKAKILDLT